MVAQQILVLLVQVRALVEQQKACHSFERQAFFIHIFYVITAIVTIAVVVLFIFYPFDHFFDARFLSIH